MRELIVMAKTVRNPAIGHRITFLQTAQQTNGDLLQLAVLAPLADSYDPSIPLPLLKAMIAILGGAGRLLGYKARYARYSS